MKTTSMRARALSCALLAGTACCGLTAQPAAAQTLDTAPPVRSSHDENGVDVARGYFKTSVTDISIGPDGPGGLSYTRSFGSALAGGGSNFDFGVFPGAGQTLVGVGSRSYAFTPSGSAFVSADGSGATLIKSGSTYTLTSEDGTIIYYGYTVVATADANRQARATSITSPTGDKITLTWVDVTWCVVNNQDVCSPSNLRTAVRLQAVSNSSGYQLHFNYTRGDIILASHAAAWKQLDGITALNNAVDYCDPAAHSCSFSQSWPSVGYSGGAVTDTRGHVTTYAGSSSGYAITRPGSSSPNLNVSQDVNARVTSVVRDGLAWTYSYSLSGTTATMTVTDPLGHQRVYTSDANVGLPTAIQDENGLTTAFQYDGSGRLTRVTAPEGNYVEYTYDARGNVTQAQGIAKTGSGLAPIVAGATYPTSCSNAPTCNKPTSTTDERGNTTDYTYDATHGGLLTVTAPAPATGATRPQTRYAYSSLQAYVKDSGGAIVASGVPATRLTAVSTCQTGASCAGAADEVKTAIAYGSTGVANNLLPTSVSTGAGDDSLTAITAMAYDDVGNLLTVDGPLAGTADAGRFRYDAGRLVIGSVSPDPDEAGSLKHRAVRATYNSDWQPTKVERGTVNSQSDADWANFIAAEAVETTYDSAARPVVQKLVSGTTTYGLTQTSFDGESRVDCIAQRMNPAEFGSLPADACALDTAGSYGPDRIVKTVYDAGDRVTQVKTALGTADETNQITATYTSNGQPEFVTDAEGNVSRYYYDGHDRVSHLYFPSKTTPGQVSSGDLQMWVYDAAGNLWYERKRDGVYIYYTYDALNRLTLKNLTGTEPDVTYSYDLLGRLTGASQIGHALTFTWDALGRNLTQTGPLGTVSTQWDLAGRSTRLTYPDNFYVTYDHLVTGETTAIRDTGATSGLGVIATIAYDDLGRRTSLTRGNGTVTGYQYDAVSRLSQLTQDLSGTGDDLTLGFSHNPASQIVSNTRSNDLYAWTSHGSGTTSTTANGLNQIASWVSTLGYDAKGNVTSGGNYTYTYSSENLLTALSNPNGTVQTSSTYAYDPLMRLWNIDSSNSALDAQLAYDGDEIVYEGLSDSRTRRYVFGPGVDEPLVAYLVTGTGTTRTWYHADERGSMIRLSTDTGAASGSPGKYDEYGVGTGVSRFHYTGQYWLADGNLHYFRSRVLDPRLGRFLQPDPIGYEAGMNLYAYVGGDPVNFTDPLGLTPTQVICTGTRICPQHDSGGTGGGAGSGGGKDTSNGKDSGGTGNRDTTVAQLFGNTSWGGFGGSMRYQCVQRCGYPTSGVDDGQGNVIVYGPAVYGWVPSVVGEAGQRFDSVEGVDLACFSPAARARCAAAVASALLMINARIAARQIGLRIVTKITLAGGRSGQFVKTLVGPANSVIRGQGGRVFFTNGRGQVVRDITYARARAVQPGVGFVGSKVPPSNVELRILDALVGQ